MTGSMAATTVAILAIQVECCFQIDKVNAMTRMIVRLYKLPVLLALLGLLALYLFGIWLPEHMSDSRTLVELGAQSAKFASTSAALLFIVSGGWALHSTIRLFRWSSGKETGCPRCDGMVAEKSGRYGPYFKCLACGKSSKWGFK